jgi:hypothetical protein
MLVLMKVPKKELKKVPMMVLMKEPKKEVEKVLD